LCVNEDLYLQSVDEYNFDNVIFNPTKKWEIRTTNASLKELYIENVKNQDKIAKKQSDKYRIDDMKFIKSNSKYFELDDLSLLNKYEILYDLKEPKLKFILKDNSNLNINDKYYELLIAMLNISLKNNFFNEGCHICLNIKNDESSIEGHIRSVYTLFFNNIKFVIFFSFLLIN
jgi:hypothetical protein